LEADMRRNLSYIRGVIEECMRPCRPTLRSSPVRHLEWSENTKCVARQHLALANPFAEVRPVNMLK
jgi:hypothetical protein